MFSKKLHTITAALVLCLSASTLAGCGNNNAANPTPQTQTPAANNQNMTEPAPADNNVNTPADGNRGNGNNPVEDLQESNNMSERAEKIAQAIVDGVDDVEDANVIISEHVAYAAIQIKSDAQKGDAEAIKKAAIDKAKEADKDLTDVYVSESADIFTRIKEIGDAIGEGKPISGFVEELENLFVRVTPSK